MASFVKFEIFSEDLAKGHHDFTATTGHEIRVMLTNTAPLVATHVVKTDLTDLATAGGYTAGGADTQNGFSRTGGVSTITGVDVVWTGTGAGFGPFRYAVLYNQTQTTPLDPLIGYWDYGSAITVLDTETFTADFAVTGLFTVT